MNIKVFRIPGKAWDLRARPEEILESLLIRNDIAIDVEKDSVIDSNGEIVKDIAKRICCDNDIYILCRPIRGEAPTPKIKVAVKYLVQQGYKEGGGKGDHRKFKSIAGDSVILNPAKGDHKHLDLGSAKSLARHLGKSLGELYETLSN